MTEPQVFDGVGYYEIGNVAITLWQLPGRVPRIDWTYTRVDQLAAANAGGIVHFVLILPSSSPPDGPGRAELQQRMRKLGPSLSRLVVVPLGDAIWLALVRSIVRAVMMVTGQSKVQFVASSERQGLDRLYDQPTVATAKRSEVEAGIKALYRAMAIPRAASSDAAA